MGASRDFKDKLMLALALVAAAALASGRMPAHLRVAARMQVVRLVEPEAWLAPTAEAPFERRERERGAPDEDAFSAWIRDNGLLYDGYGEDPFDARASAGRHRDDAEDDLDASPYDDADEDSLLSSFGGAAAL